MGLSTINVTDTVALKTENESIKKEVGLLFKGIDKDKKYVLYRAFNELPSKEKKVEHHEFTDEL